MTQTKDYNTQAYTILRLLKTRTDGIFRYKLALYSGLTRAQIDKTLKILESDKTITISGYGRKTKATKDINFDKNFVE